MVSMESMALEASKGKALSSKGLQALATAFVKLAHELRDPQFSCLEWGEPYQDDGSLRYPLRQDWGKMRFYNVTLTRQTDGWRISFIEEGVDEFYFEEKELLDCEKAFLDEFDIKIDTPSALFIHHLVDTGLINFPEKDEAAEDDSDMSLEAQLLMDDQRYDRVGNGGATRLWYIDTTPVPENGSVDSGESMFHGMFMHRGQMSDQVGFMAGDNQTAEDDIKLKWVDLDFLALVGDEVFVLVDFDDVEDEALVVLRDEEAVRARLDAHGVSEGMRLFKAKMNGGRICENFSCSRTSVSGMKDAPDFLDIASFRQVPIAIVT